MSKLTTSTEVRLSYENLLVPRSQNPGDDPKYSVSVIIPKTDTDTIAAIKKAVAEALAEGTAKKWGGKRPANLKNPLRDADAEGKDDEAYAGSLFLNAKGPRGGAEQPILMNKNAQETTDSKVIYSGVYGRISLQFYAYDTNGNRGIAVGVSAFMSGEHGDPLANAVTADSARSDFGVATPVSSAADEFATSTTSEAAPAADAPDDDPWAV